ncbi:MAG TPA: hypothetical protein VKM55_23635 [Candidatus Lokiarchaeia archaeon]|nr:hypothetical protein [Candidatus Lokiarchaeia archaeon]
MLVRNLLDKNQESSDIKILDPFAGGGTIPYEAAYLGCSVYASDLNPVSVIVNKASVEFPVAFHDDFDSLLDLINIQAQKIQSKLEEQISPYFENPESPDKRIIFYIWAHTVPCQNLKCKLNIPMFKSFLINEKEQVALVPEIPEDYAFTDIQFQLGWTANKKNLDGWYKKGALTCPRCKTTIKLKDVHDFFQKNELNEKLYAIVELDENEQRSYRLATERDVLLYQNAKLAKKPLGIDVPLPPKALGWSLQLYGIHNISQMFNERQYLFASTVASIINEMIPELEKTAGKEKTAAIVTYLQFSLDKVLDYNSRFSILNQGTRIAKTWSRPERPMNGDYAETNPLAISNQSGNWMKFFTELRELFEKLKQRNSFLNKGSPIPKIYQMDAQNLEFDDSFFDFIITDPPYYDSIPYAIDSDFFYAWDRLTLSQIFPDLFIKTSTPKEEELIVEVNVHGGTKNAKHFYEKGLSKAFTEMYRVLKKLGIAVVVFANKKLDAWETLIQAFISSNFVITATWPVPMESKSGKMGTYARAQLTSVVLVIARKLEKEKPQYFDKKFQNLVIAGIEDRMGTFWKEGIRGADFFLCAIGPALTYFSKYEKILDPGTDKELSVSEYLSFVQNIMINFAIKQIASTITSGTLDKITQFYLVWRWGYGMSSLPFDEVKKMYQALSIDFEDLDGKLIERQKKRSEYGCKSANDQYSELPFEKLKKQTPETLIDYLQLACYLWEQDQRVLLDEKINDALLKYSDSFWTIAQALYDILPDCQEATQIQGLLQRFKKLKASNDKVKIEKQDKQKTLLSFMDKETRVNDKILEDEDVKDEAE